MLKNRLSLTKKSSSEAKKDKDSNIEVKRKNPENKFSGLNDEKCWSWDQ
jgi:hypothetical protein